MKVNISKVPKTDNEYAITMTGLTAGKIMVIQRALQAYDTPVARDVRVVLDREIEKFDESRVRM
jgi:hypothetical protein